MSHTPGPWTFVKTKDEMPCRIINGKGFDEIAEMRGAYDWAMQDANARLISAAPDLLETLYRVRDDLMFQHGAAAYNVNFSYIDEAIAKATLASSSPS